ncbi:8344_t:CDS:2, partial [Scutellospora calospora]
RELSPTPTQQRRSTGSSPMSTMESTITQLLVTTKSLLEALTAWSMGRVSKQQVSDIYVKLAMELNHVVQLFDQAGVDTRIHISNMENIPQELNNMASIPQVLKVCLEDALGEEASPTSLENHLPKIKDIIVTLLQSLKTKQSTYRQTQSSYENNNSQSTSPINGTQPFSLVNQSPSPPLPPNNRDDPVSVLKRDNLERRASRRYSAWGTGKRTNLRQSKKIISAQPPEINIPEMAEMAEVVHEEATIKPPNISVITSPIPSPIEYVPPNNKTDKPSLDKLDVTDDAKDSNNKKLITLYLQLGKDVKKIKYDGDISMTALQMLFVEKFQYNPGMDDFPKIFIKDPQVGILYELEDMSEVKDKS